MRQTGVKLALLLPLALAAAAGPQAAERETLLEQMDKAMLGAGGQLRNAQARIERGLAKITREGTAPGPTGATVAEKCCRSNVEAIHGKLVQIQSLLEQTRTYYADRQNQTALNVVQQMEVRLKQFAEGMLVFARTPEESVARSALRGLIRPWNEFRNGVEVLQGCCPMTGQEGIQLAPPPEPSRGSSRKPGGGAH